MFLGTGGVDIPLLEKRQENLQQAGKVLLEKFDGKFINAVEQSNFDAIKLAKIVFNSFTSFEDTATYLGKKVNLYKRAQIVPNDLSYLKSMDKRFDFKNIDQLTAFADYKLPQIMRNEGLMVFSKELAGKVDNYELIISKSMEEVEIRAATIWGVELIRQELGEKYSAG